MGQPLKIWVLEIGEPLPLEDGVRLHRFGKFTQYLASRGHQVTWWSSGFSHAPKKHIVPRTEVRMIAENLKLYLLKGIGYPRNVSLKRFAHQRDFARQFSEKAPGEEVPDIIIVPVPTLEGASAAAEYALARGVPYLVDVRDRWPGEFVELLPKPLRGLGPLLFKPLFDRAKFIYKNATAITGISREERDYGMAFSSRELTELDRVVPHGYRRDILPDAERKIGEAWLKTLNIREEDFVICFFGTIGRFFQLSTVIEAAKKLAPRPIKFILGGAGSSLDGYRREASGVPGVIFPGWLNDAQIQAVLSRSSAGIAPYKDESIMTMPNKPFEYMSAGLPILYSIKGELAELLTQHNCGLHYQADDSDALVAQVLKLFENRQMSAEMGGRAEKLFKENFSLDVVFPKFEKLIYEVASQEKVGH